MKFTVHVSKLYHDVSNQTSSGQDFAGREARVPEEKEGRGFDSLQIKRIGSSNLIIMSHNGVLVLSPHDFVEKEPFLL